MKNLIWVLASVLVLTACQKDEDGSRTELGARGQGELVEAADGTLYSVSCLRTVASQIQSQGASAMSGCSVENMSASGASEERGRFLYGSDSNSGTYYYPSSNYSSGYSWVTYYPPAYHNYTTYYPNYNTTYAGYNWNSSGYSSNNYSVFYGSSYNPYNDYRYRKDPFCNHVLGGSYDVNLYYVLGYSSPTTFSSYNSKCSECVYAWNYDRCVKNRCGH